MQEEYVFLLGDTNMRVGSTETGGVVGKFGVDRVNENRQYLVNACVERGAIPRKHLHSAQDDTQAHMSKEE